MKGTVFSFLAVEGTVMAWLVSLERKNKVLCFLSTLFVTNSSNQFYAKKILNTRL